MNGRNDTSNSNDSNEMNDCNEMNSSNNECGETSGLNETNGPNRTPLQTFQRSLTKRDDGEEGENVSEPKMSPRGIQMMGLWKQPGNGSRVGLAREIVEGKL